MDSHKRLFTSPLLIVLALIVSAFLGFLFANKETDTVAATYNLKDTYDALYKQAVVSTSNTPHAITKLYNGHQLVGVITDETRLDTLFNEVYETEYKEEFEGTRLGFVQDVYQTTELSYNVYENIDDELFKYIYDQKLIAVEVDKVTFSNGAVIYVKNRDDFAAARKAFILGYISNSVYDSLANNEKIPSLVDVGVQETGFEVVESITISKGLATIDDILLNETEILNFLSFGYDPVIQSYSVKDFDTIDGIAWLNEMSTNQLMSINHDKIANENQVLKPGTELNIAKFNSPLTVRVTKERMVVEKVNPQETVYREDPSLREGLTRVEQTESPGYDKVLYEDVYENDTSVASTRLKSETVEEPVQGIVYVGTYVEPKIGSGELGWPMFNARVSCGWYCYGGHAAIDFQSYSNRGYGPIYAADRGVVIMNQYYYGYGNYFVIDHNNGMTTSYAHMEAPGYFPVGSTVARGEQIGYVGMTGVTTGPHVHFEVTVNGSKVNPCIYLGC